MTETLVLLLLFPLIAALYASVGHAGASGFLAVMALVGVAPERMKPTALVLNIVVATLATLNFRRAAVYYPRQVLPLALGSVPLAFIGGSMHPSSPWFRPLLALVLGVAALRLLLPRRAGPGPERSEPHVPGLAAVPIGAVIGLVSGLTGTGGGIFLTPLLVFFRWATIRQSAGISALFILLNSISALVGNLATAPPMTAELAVLAAAAGLGGFAGSWMGARRLPEHLLAVALGVVVAIAAVKMALS